MPQFLEPAVYIPLIVHGRRPAPHSRILSAPLPAHVQKGGTRPALHVLIYQGHCPCPARSNPSLRSGSLLCACNWTSSRFQTKFRGTAQAHRFYLLPAFNLFKSLASSILYKVAVTPRSRLSTICLNEFKVHWRLTTYVPDLPKSRQSCQSLAKFSPNSRQSPRSTTLVQCLVV